MDAILSFLNEMRRSDWDYDVPFQQRKYNGIAIQESEHSYYNKIAPMYSAAVVALISVPTEKYEILQGLLVEVENCQKCFELPSDELLNSLMHDFNQSNNQMRGLKDDYNYLCFVRNCMKTQMDFLGKFKKKFPSTKSNRLDETEAQETTQTNISNQNEPIKGVKGLATYLKIGVTKAQDVINSNILQDNGIAYRVGNAWNFNPQKLDELLANHPNILYKRNK